MHQINTNLLERAAELIDELENHPCGANQLIIAALENNDLDELYRLVIFYEGELSREYFRNWEIST